jgi:putative hemolysin
MELPILFILLTLLSVEAFFSGSELALLTCDRTKLKKLSKAGSRGASLALRLIQKPERVLSTTLLMTNSCIMGISVLSTIQCRRWFGEHGELAAIVMASLLVISLGELLPKLLFQRYANAWAPWIAGPVFYLQGPLAPFISVVSLYTRQLEKIVSPIDRAWNGNKTGREELQTLVSHDSTTEEIGLDEKKIIRRILKFREVPAKDGALPLTQVDAIDQDTTVREAIAEFDRSRHTRMPVYEGRIDNIVGVVDISAVFATEQPNANISTLMRPAHFVAETQKLEAVLLEMNISGSKMSIVVNEYGGAVGILTREDIVEQIVGDLNDEDDLTKATIRLDGPDKYTVRAHVQIADLNQELRLGLPEGDYDTLAGYLMHELKHIPKVGERHTVSTDRGLILFRILHASKKKLESVQIEIREPSRD